MNACQLLLLKDYNVFSMRTIVEVARFYKLYLMYDKEDKEDRNKLLDLLSTKKLAHLYSILYKNDYRQGATKSELLYEIEKYFKGLM